MPSTASKAGFLRHVPQEKLTVSKPTWWLESRFHFSFAGYHNPSNMNFGALRVLNDDLVEGKAGFGRHPHRDAEIFSYIVDGQLSHADNMGNKEALGRGSVQYLSAGTGITHSEMNDGDERCRFLQIWLTPDKRGVKPQYGSKTYAEEARKNKLLRILAGNTAAPSWDGVNDSPASDTIHQDAHVYVSENESGVSHSISLALGRQLYLVCIEGALGVNDVHLRQRDAIEAVNTSDTDAFPLSLAAGDGGSHFLLIEMARG